MPPKQPTALPACAPRVRSVRWTGRCGEVLLHPSSRTHSLAGATSAAACGTTRPARTLLTTARAFAFALACGFRGRAVTVAVACFGLERRRAFASIWLRHECLHRETKSAALIALEQLHLHSIALV